MGRWHAFCMLQIMRAHDLLAIVCVCRLCSCVCMCCDGMCEGLCIGGVHGVRRRWRRLVVVRSKRWRAHIGGRSGRE